MGWRYIAAGSAIVDNVILFGSGEVSSVTPGGGGIYAVSGLRLWDDSCAVAAYSGRDFEEFYGGWLDGNGIGRHICGRFDNTRTVDLIYNSEGTYCTEDHWPEYRIKSDMVDRALLEPLISSDTAAIHILGRPDLDNLADISGLRQKYGVKLGVEIEALGLFGDADAMELLKEMTGKYIDFFSINYYEAKHILRGIRDRSDAIEALSGLGCPVFFRVGRDGAYLIKDRRAYYSPMVDDFGTVDPTGCGNTSTSAAFQALCEGAEPLEASYIGAVTASLNASFKGLIPRFDRAVRARCRELVRSHMKTGG